ncbi:sodium:solute symporter family transporter [Yunchengibacter salinarum]|uniref:sodium:solute symporter family transporter n=1 Tax=Yunchengibacter salinarum TaxID=3133399 RepID=UPI0035B620AC
MTALDYIVIAAYLLGMVGMGAWFSRQTSRADYFLGDRTFGWFPLTLSTMATQLSAISFISAPAFVGIREGGGLIWLSYELAVPLAMIFLMTVLMPGLYRAGYVSIYEYLEARFDQSTRFLISIVFQISRAFGTGVSVYAMALILREMVGVSLTMAILLTAVVTAIYSLMGGMKAVVYGDAAQMGLIFLGLVLCIVFGLAALGGMDGLAANVDVARLVAVDFSDSGLTGGEFGFWPMLFGGLVLYVSYYGADQTQAQRLLSSSDEGRLRRVLTANGLLRFPMVLLYCFLGLVLGTLAHVSPDLSAEAIAADPDTLLPRFILTFMPAGLVGLLVVAILSATMSSLSSVINSLTAVTVEDISRFSGGAERQEKHYVKLSRLVALGWSVIILLFSLYAGNIADTVIEAINKVGSMFYGPILATFLLALLSRGVRPMAANLGLLAGVGVNMALWLGAPEVFWFWWNATGLVASLSVSLLAETVRGRIPAFQVPVGALVEGRANVAILLAAFAAILATVSGITLAFAGAGP